jgi:lipopolysaccharide export system protein LptA
METLRGISMNVQNFKGCRLTVAVISAAVFLFITPIVQDIGWAQEKPIPSLGSNEKIQVTADSLTIEHDSRYADLVGKVKVTQGDAEIKADNIRIYYKEGVGGEIKPAQGEDAIEKIVAKGNVKIRYENKVAVTEEAVYITKTKVLMLIGDNSKFTSGNDSISGARITVYRDSNRIMIESSKAQRVEAVFYPGDKKQ